MRADSWLRVFAGACLAVALSAFGAEAEAPKEFIIIQSAAADPEICNWDTAKQVQFATLWSSPETERCVRASGVVKWRALFESLEAYYELDASLSSLDEKRERRRVGVYAKEEVQEQLGQLERQQVELVGLLDDCDRFRGPNVLMVFGFCHYTGGRILIVSQFRALPTTRVVLKGERQRRLHGNLEPYVRNSAFRDLVEDRLRAWIAMIQSQDEESLRTLLGLSAGDTAQDGESELWMLFGSAPPIADRFKDVERNPRAIFRRLDHEAREMRAEDSSYDAAVACVCLQDTCRDDWPIAMVDAHVTRTRPYACMRIEQSGNRIDVSMGIDNR